MKKICAVGHIALDFILTVQDFAKQDGTPEYADSFQKEYGGFAANIGVICNKLGLRAGLAGGLGSDLYGKIYLRYLKEQGVDISNIKVVGDSTAKAILIFNEHSKKERAYFYEGAGAVAPDLNRKWLKGYDILHLCAKDPYTNLSFSKDFNGTVSFDPGAALAHIEKAELRDIIKRTNILFARKRELKKIFKILSLDEDLKKLHKLGPEIIIITMGKNGAEIHETNKSFHIPALAIKKVYVSGAGDGFRAGFLSAFSKGYGIEEAGKIGSVVASFVLLEQGAQTSIPTWNEVLDKYEELKKRNLI